MSAPEKTSGHKLWERVLEEADLIAIFLIVLLVLLAHETLNEIAHKAELKDVIFAWAILLFTALAFFVFVFRIAIRQTRREVIKSIDDRLEPISERLKTTAKIFELDALEHLLQEKVLMPEMDVMKIEQSVQMAVWVVSPDFRYELGDRDCENYTSIIATNLLKGVPYFYFVPHDNATGIFVKRFQTKLETYLQSGSQPAQSIHEALQRVTVISLSSSEYPATALFGCALYEINEADGVFVEYFPRGTTPGWNRVYWDTKDKPVVHGDGHEPNTILKLKGSLQEILRAHQSRVDKDGSYNLGFWPHAFKQN